MPVSLCPKSGENSTKSFISLQEVFDLATTAHEALSPQLYRGPEDIFQDPVLARPNLRNCCHDGT
jgi:hypothetical protein